ncbi:MAG: beta strand repeat-containing protein [Fimbriiglobus sp.]
MRLGLLIGLFVFSLSSQTLLAQTQWTNSAGGDFFTPSNWNTGVVPGATNDVEITLFDNFPIGFDGTRTIKSLAIANGGITFNQTGGSLTILNSFTRNSGFYNLHGGSLNANGGIVHTDGAMFIDYGAVLNLTGTMALNGGLGSGYSVRSYNGTIKGGSIVSNHIDGRLEAINLTLDNVSIGNNVINGFGTLRIQNGTTFPSGHNLIEGRVLEIGPNQSVHNFRLTFSNEGFFPVSSTYGTQDNSLVIIGPSGSSHPTIQLTGTTTNFLFVGGGGVGTSRSILNTGVIENNSASGSIIYISPSGDFTNAGILRANSPGRINIAPAGAFILAPGSSLQTANGGFFEIDTLNIQNAGLLVIRPADSTVSTQPTGNVTNTNTATTTVLDGASLNVGNNAASTVTNTGAFNVNNGATLNIGGVGALGTYTNTSGIAVLNGTTNGSVDVNGGFLLGSGVINGTTAHGMRVRAGGTLKPGNSPGQITIGGGLDINGTLEIDIAINGTNNSTTVGNTTAGDGFDTVRVQPPPGGTSPTDVIVRTALQLRLMVADGNLGNQPGVGFWGNQQAWTIMTATNGSILFSLGEAGEGANPLVNLPTANVALIDGTSGNTIDPSSFYPGSSFYFSLETSGNATDLKLNWNPVPVPEPAWLIVPSSLLPLCFGWIRRRRSSELNPTC